MFVWIKKAESCKTISFIYLEVLGIRIWEHIFGRKKGKDLGVLKAEEKLSRLTWVVLKESQLAHTNNLHLAMHNWLLRL